MFIPSSPEPLEARIAPASLVSPTTVTYEDVDGSAVTIKLSKPLFTAVTANTILHFDVGSVSMDPAAPQQLQLIDLRSLDAQGVSVTVSAHRDAVHGGDAYANVGAIDAGGRDLGVVSIAGDLGYISAGDSTYTTPAITSLTVQSMGALGTSTQAAGGSLAGGFTGPVGSLNIRGDFNGASLTITAPTAQDAAMASLSSLKIGGSLIGGADDGMGSITVSGKLGKITVGGDLRGGGGDGSGEISAKLAIGKAQVGGSLRGAAGDDSGSLQSLVSIGSVLVKHDVRGGAGEDSGVIDGGKLLGAMKILGSVVGAGPDSGSVRAEALGGTITSVFIGGDLQGGSGAGSGYVHAETKLGPTTVLGSVIGDAGPDSGVIYAGDFFLPHFITSVMIGGDLRGGTGDGSGSIGAVFGQLGSAVLLDVQKITIHGSVIGNGVNSASINAHDVKVLTIGGSVIGGAGNSGVISTDGNLPKVTIGGSLLGGSGEGSGALQAFSLGSVRIGQDLVGGTAERAGEIVTSGAVSSVTIVGSIRSGTAAHTGSVDIGSTLGSLTVSGSVTGSAAFPVVLEAAGNLAPAPQSPAPAIGKVTISGSASYLQLLAGFNRLSSVPVNADASIGAVLIGHDWTASSISAGADAHDGMYGNSDDTGGSNHNTAAVARIASITIKGQLLGTVGGTDAFGFDAESFGPIRVGAALYVAPAAGSTVALGATGDVLVRNVTPV